MMTDDEILEVAHRMAWRYKKSSDPNHSDTYTFNRTTLLEFARKLMAAEREACAAVVEEESMRGLPDEPTPDGILQIVCGVVGAPAIRERSNAKSQATDAALSRQVRSDDGLCGNGEAEKVGAGGTAPERYELPRCSRCGQLLHYGTCAKVATHNALGEGRERGILREASSGEAATSTDGLGG